MPGQRRLLKVRPSFTHTLVGSAFNALYLGEKAQAEARVSATEAAPSRTPRSALGRSFSLRQNEHRSKIASALTAAGLPE